jgi:protoporphyrinogen oxidase
MKMGQVVIVGGGIAGLTAGYELAKKGRPVTILEKEDRVGGLSRSFRYDGFTFDIGPHRFHTDNVRVGDFLHEILEDETLYISRDSKVHFRKKYYRWPLRPSILFKLPLSIQARTAFDVLIRKLKRGRPARNFQEYILNNYGPTLYNHFFRDYTRKFLDIPPDLLDLDWAKVAMSMAIIDEDLPYTDLWELCKLIIKPMPVCTTFLYPKGGVGAFCNALADHITRSGGNIVTGARVDGIGRVSGRIHSVAAGKKDFPCDNLIWTGSIGEICGFLGVPSPALKHRSLVLYNVLLRKKIRRHFQWCYFGEGNIVFNRVSNASLFDPGSAPDGKTGLCIEVTCRENDAVWNDPGGLVPRIRQDLIRADLIGHERDIGAVRIERISDAYPIYDLHYRQRLRIAKERAGRFGNLDLAGRAGLFWYNNMDDSIVNGLDVARRLLHE